MSTNSGDRAVRTALHIARNDANDRRLHKRAADEFLRGMCMGQVIIAGNYLAADPLLVMAAKNEIRFLYHYNQPTNQHGGPGMNHRTIADHRTIAEAKALADRAAKRLAQEAESKACAEALRKWRAPFVLTQWLMGRRAT